MACWFGRPLVPFLEATQEGVSTEQASLLASVLEQDAVPGNRVAAAALSYATGEVAFDPAYYKLTYPGGDLPARRGNAADVVIRCLRRVGVDLQKQVHNDMSEHFRQYPQLWNALGPDRNIDHRRVPNLQRFFERKAEALPVSQNPSDYQPGDIVIWSLANAEQHIGIVVPGPGKRAMKAGIVGPVPDKQVAEPWVVHHLNGLAKWEGVLFDYKIEAHFRYPGSEKP